MPLLSDIYNAIDSVKRQGSNFIKNPGSELREMLSLTNDRARAFNKLQKEATAEGMEYGPKTQELAMLMAESYNPAGIISPKNVTYDTHKILVDIPIDKIMHGESILPGGKLTWPGSKELIKEYANKKTDFPPIEVVSSDASIPWMVADGSHRLEAAKLRGNKTIKAYVSPFDKEGLELISK
jgi:hypothetical protein